MTFYVSRAALDRARATIHACQMLYEHAGEVAHVCGETGGENVVVAVIDEGDMALAGIWTVPRSEVASRVPELERMGWAFTFSSGTSAESIEDRALMTAQLAFSRWTAMQRWKSKHR